MLSIPIIVLSSRLSPGRTFTIPEEHEPPEVLLRLERELHLPPRPPILAQA
jgi:hypothetical protein